MKTHTLISLSVFLMSTSFAFGQVEIDQPIQLTGGTGERAVTNLEAPVNGSDAANKDYVDNAVAASGGGGRPTQISNESPSTGTLMQAATYCNTLTEGGNSDWYLPTLEELLYVVSKGGTVVSNPTSTNNVWIREPYDYGSVSAVRWCFNFSSSGLATASWNGGSSCYARCVR